MTLQTLHLRRPSPILMRPLFFPERFLNLGFIRRLTRLSPHHEFCRRMLSEKSTIKLRGMFRKSFNVTMSFKISSRSSVWMNFQKRINKWLTVRVKYKRFLSQPFHVAEQFTGFKGVYVPVKETVRGFKEILDGLHDEIPEQLFLFCGTIDEVVEKYKQSKA